MGWLPRLLRTRENAPTTGTSKATPMTPPVHWRIRDAAWKTRGRHWDYEFISTPKSPDLPAWAGVVEDILGGEQSEAERLIYGLLKIGGAGERVYVAARFLDPTRKDWTGRPVQHMTVWFPQIDDAKLVPSLVPGDWYHQALRALESTYGRHDVFDVSEEAVRSWPRDPAESLASHISTIVRGTPDAEFEGEVRGQAEWVFRTVEKKKVSERQTSHASATGQSPRSPSRSLEMLLLAVFGLGALFYFLMRLMN